MSPPRTQYMALLALLLSASATAQEHQHAAMESSAHADGAHAMQIADQATAAQPQTSIATEASPPSAQQSAEAMQTEHAQMQHAQHSSTASAPASTKAADSTPAQRPVQADVSVAPASMHHAGMQHADVQHAAHQASANPQLDHTRQSQADSDHDATDHASMQHGQQHGAMDHSDMDHAPHAGAVTQTPASPPTGALPRTPIPEPTAEEIAAAFAPLQHHAMHAPGINHYVLLDRLEAFDTTRGSGQDWEARAWIGGDTDRLWLRSEGERQDGRTQAASVEALYGHAISPWWDLLVGARQDIGADEHRSWAAFGVQGLAPYKFETEATLYVGSGSRAALRLEGEYEVLLTNRLILQPRVEADIALTDDDRRGVGSGLEQVEAGLRLRYEITRRFAPYIGWVHSRSFGDTARRAAIDDEPARDSRFVAGVRIWF
ncbi:copper resistance protein B [Xanthomonas arboricola pv. corylina]|uniref:copper resistance protein B n=2 Tax=Xanthomonas arboricola TaxID=56448 RepID=UPI00037E6B80|nr:copper resistance protein B [Xanthomonas arboricola]MDN0202577.1 copper resistance protein B [Xanthomonas arboricola pv. corylina]MDN0208027.1 copper resistance protein B [Xanthomonas arboricola pv. corylina]MDN0211787.1 copper resistance protein B [Xanthomonas arboricola pv. corylina]MDN0214519.1 copper resistance protein B [Xanthomonas arboricola pv. corylina]PPU16495.1 copper resistance protein B [Xanthomonas arboricola pv. corylina]